MSPVTAQAIPFLDACRGQRGERVPVWIMRQAGRYLPEYRALRERIDFQTAIRTPEVAAEITLQPLARFPLDAAILFSDIMTPLEGMGVDVDFSPGPVVRAPLRTEADIGRLRDLEPSEGVPFVLDALGLVRQALPRERAVIGFAGAPFTLFCYLVEGSGSKDFMSARHMLHAEPDLADPLLGRLGRSMARYLTAQADAGADALMLFDSWIGLLSPPVFRHRVLPVLRSVVAQVRREARQPVIYYANGASHLLPALAEVGADVLGVDWRTSLTSANAALGGRAVVQGNLDPALLFAPRATLELAAERVLREGAAAAGHIFNLGHGIHRATDPGQVAFLVDTVHARSAGGAR